MSLMLVRVQIGKGEGGGEGGLMGGGEGDGGEDPGRALSVRVVGG